MTGIIMEKDKQEYIVLTDKGSFEKVKNKGEPWNVGDTVNVTVPNINHLKLLIAAILIVCFFPFAAMQYMVNWKVTSYYTIDINPSIELGVSSRDRVLTASGENQDGKNILKKLSIKNKSITDAMNLITLKAFEEGYLRKDESNDILISQITLPKPFHYTGRVKTEDIVSSVSQNLKDLSVDANINDIVLTPLARKEATKHGVSSGKYVILLMAKEKGLKLSSSQIKSKPIKKAVTDAGGDYSTIVNAVESNKNINQLVKKYTSEAAKKKNKSLPVQKGKAKNNNGKETKQNNQKDMNTKKEKASINKNNKTNKKDNAKKNSLIGNKDSKKIDNAMSSEDEGTKDENPVSK